MAPITAAEATMSFFTLPAEIRVRVYKYLWQGTWVRMKSPTIDSDMWEQELDVCHYCYCLGSEHYMSALLRSCRQIHSEALAIYHDLVELHISRYAPRDSYPHDEEKVVQSYSRCVERIDRQDDYQPPFKGFRNITIPTYREVDHLPIIARQCPDMRKLTFFEDDTRNCGHTWVTNPRAFTIESAIASKLKQIELFCTVHEDGDRSVQVGLDLLSCKSTLQRTKRSEHMKDVKIFLKHEIEVEEWDDERRYDIVSHTNCVRCLCSTDSQQFGTLDLQSGVLLFEAPEGQCEVRQTEYIACKKRSAARDTKE